MPLVARFLNTPQLRQAIADFVAYYNHQRYHEALHNVVPADVYHGQQQQVLSRRQQIKQHTLHLRRADYLRQRQLSG